jgi:hypothetical protein
MQITCSRGSSEYVWSKEYYYVLVLNKHWQKKPMNNETFPHQISNWKAAFVACLIPKHAGLPTLYFKIQVIVHLILGIVESLAL